MKNIIFMSLALLFFTLTGSQTQADFSCKASCNRFSCKDEAKLKQCIDGCQEADEIHHCMRLNREKAAHLCFDNCVKGQNSVNCVEGESKRKNCQYLLDKLISDPLA